MLALAALESVVGKNIKHTMEMKMTLESQFCYFCSGQVMGGIPDS